MIINGRCLGDSFTGVQRYLTEILKRAPDGAELISPNGKHDGIHGHMWEQFMLPRIASKRVLWSPANSGPVFKARHAITLHDLTMLRGADSMTLPTRAIFYRQLLSQLTRHCDLIITVSEFNKGEICEELNLADNRVLVTPLGVDRSVFYKRSSEEVAAAKLAYKIPDKYIVFAGAGSARKNLRGLLEAWGKIPASCKNDAALVVVGDLDPNNPVAFDGTRLRVTEDGIRILGRLTDDRLASLITGAAAFAYPSLREGFGLPILEAFSCGTPCVCSNTTSLPEVGGDACRYFNPADTDDMADALVDVLENSVTRAMLSKLGTERVNKFSWDRTARLTFDALSKL